MDIREEIKKAVRAGTTAASIARRIKCDPSTLNKWLRGDRQTVSDDIVNRAAKALLEIKQEWENIMIE